MLHGEGVPVSAASDAQQAPCMLWGLPVANIAPVNDGQCVLSCLSATSGKCCELAVCGILKRSGRCRRSDAKWWHAIAPFILQTAEGTRPDLTKAERLYITIRGDSKATVRKVPAVPFAHDMYIRCV